MEKLESFLSMETLILFDFIILPSRITVRHTYLSDGLDFGVSIPQKFLLSIRQSCLRLEQEEYQSIDEEIIPYKGRNKLKQYIPKKPKK
ncbi:hypothetical protein T08_2879 [Trichinella sp. T8]|nr:hypothetical protein T08_2879 [Trichinella sp. T8]